MFRAFVLSIVLSVAVAPNAALLCIASCHPQPATSSVSHHGEHSAALSASHGGETLVASSVMGGDNTCPNCDNVGLGAVQFLREDVRRSISALDAVQAILVPRYQLAHSTIDARPGREPGREWSLEERSLPTILRI